jgi:hypothetical protein
MSKKSQERLVKARSSLACFSTAAYFEFLGEGFGIERRINFFADDFRIGPGRLSDMKGTQEKDQWEGPGQGAASPHH